MDLYVSNQKTTKKKTICKPQLLSHKTEIELTPADEAGKIPKIAGESKSVADIFEELDSTNNDLEIESSDMENVIPRNQQSCEDALWVGKLGLSWYQNLSEEIRKDYFQNCLRRVEQDRMNHTVFPPDNDVFRAFKMTPLENVKVVIIGQDPYHGIDQAMGLCFSVCKGIKPPPSLINIFNEIGIKSSHGDLSSWASQGVFLLNSLLTVISGKPMSHKAIGWEAFTDAVVDVINRNCKGTVFMLWGRAAKNKAKNVNRCDNYVLEAGHPSPLSVRFFSGCCHFRKCNEYLENSDRTHINWYLS